MAGYNPNYGQVVGGAQPAYGAKPGQNQFYGGYDPSSQASTAAPSSSSQNPYGSQDLVSEEFAEATEYKSPKELAKEAKRKAEKKDKKKNQKREDAMNAVKWLLFLGGFNVILWTLPIFGKGWHTRMFSGFGVGFTKISTGLLSVQIDVECTSLLSQQFEGGNWEVLSKLNPSQQICEVFSSMAGTHSMHSAKDLACAISSHACGIMQSIWYCSFFLIFAYAMSALLSTMGAIFLYYYWYENHLEKIRSWSMGFYVISPLFGILAFLMYNMICPDLGELPRSWTAKTTAMFPMAAGAFSVKPIGDDNIMMRYGWCWYMSYITICFAIAAPASWGLWFRKHYQESKHETIAENELMAIDDAINQVEEQQFRVEQGGRAGDYVPPAAVGQYPGAQAYAYPPQSAGAYPPQSAGAYPPQAYAPQSAGPYAQSGAYGAYAQPAAGYAQPAAGYPQQQQYQAGAGMISY